MFTEKRLKEMHKEVKNKDVFEFFTKKRKIRRRMRMIFEEKMPSRRYDLLFKEKTTDFSITSPIMELGNITFLPEQEKFDNKLVTLARRISKKECQMSQINWMTTIWLCTSSYQKASYTTWRENSTFPMELLIKCL